MRLLADGAVSHDVDVVSSRMGKVRDLPENGSRWGHPGYRLFVHVGRMLPPSLRRRHVLQRGEDRLVSVVPGLVEHSKKLLAARHLASA